MCLGKEVVNSVDCYEKAEEVIRAFKPYLGVSLYNLVRYIILCIGSLDFDGFIERHLDND